MINAAVFSVVHWWFNHTSKYLYTGRGAERELGSLFFHCLYDKQKLVYLCLSSMKVKEGPCL